MDYCSMSYVEQARDGGESADRYTQGPLYSMN